jgi:non-specific serine/threonine protein kinase
VGDRHGPARTANAWRTYACVGARSFEIIETLVRSAGELVTKDELMSRVWPGAIIGENTIQIHISAIRKTLGPDRSMLKTVSGRGYGLLGDWQVRSHDPAGPTVSREIRLSGMPPAMNLPMAATELVGRSQTLQLLHAFATAYRLVTLTGAGGIGKTVLAIEAARGLYADFQDAGHSVPRRGRSGYTTWVLVSPFFLPSNAEVLGNNHQIGK